MWQYIFLLLRRQPGKSVLASSGFLLAACALILLSATTQTTLVRGNQIISQNWRPTYDLVVLPPQVKIPADPRVPSDLLAGYGGGICTDARTGGLSFGPQPSQRLLPVGLGPECFQWTTEYCRNARDGHDLHQRWRW